MLPEPWRSGPEVLAFVLPMSWNIHEGQTKDEEYNILAAVSPDETQLYGLQVVDVELGKLSDQREVFAHYQTKMLEPAYVGPIATLPNGFTLDEDTTVLLFVKDEMWRQYIDLKRVWRPVRFKC